MTKGVVVIYFSHLGGRLNAHQKVVLEADAKVIAQVLGYDFGARHQTAVDDPAPVFFVPDDTLLVDEASSLGIRRPNDFYGGVVPHPFVKTKAITHALVQEDADRPEGWSSAFAESVREIVLPGYTAFSARDARVAATRMLRRGAVRVKKPLGASGRGQTLVTTLQELDALLEKCAASEMATYGLVLEENLRHVRTLSVGQIAVDGVAVTYYGTQRVTKDNLGRSVYGGSDLVCVRGGWAALEALVMDADVQSAVAEAIMYDNAMSAYPGFMASRRNYDIGQGIDADGRRRSGVFESSWRIGGASSAELAALAAFARDPSIQIVGASHIEEFGNGCKAPPNAIIHFQGADPEAGPLLRYTVVKSISPQNRA
jgi:hypothetical protein